MHTDLLVTECTKPPVSQGQNTRASTRHVQIHTIVVRRHLLKLEKRHAIHQGSQYWEGDLNC